MDKNDTFRAKFMPLFWENTQPQKKNRKKHDAALTSHRTNMPCVVVRSPFMV